MLKIFSLVDIQLRLSFFFSFQKSWLKSLALTAAQWMEKNVTINRGKGFPHNGSIREMSALDGGALAEDEKRLRETENLLETEWDQVTDSDKKFSALDDSESENSDFL